LREFVKLTPSLERQCLLADRLLNAGQSVEARELLSRALGDYSFAPLQTRWRDASWAREARRLLKEAEEVPEKG
jgi:hypothetical protein